MVGFRVWSGLALGIAFGLATAGCGSDEPAAPPSGGSGTTQKVLILHTNDLHSYLNGFAPEQDYTPLTKGDDTTRGGMARLAAAIASERASAASAHEPVLLLDAGDFMMGTLFELLGTTQAPELTFFQDLGYDATTLGNHEFDWTSAGLAAILSAAGAQGVKVPIVASNLQFSADDAGDDALEAVAAAGMIQPKLVKTVGKLKVGFFGLLGSDAATVTPQAAPVTFEAIADAANRMVTELRETDHVDLVVALSHSGIHADGTGEDAKLAMDAPGIDLIVSGHTHDSLTQPVRVGNTWIVTAGSYGRFLGELSLSVTPATKAGEPATLAVDDYTLRNIDDSIAGDAATQTKVDGYVDTIDAALSGADLAYHAVVATTETDLPLPEYAEAPIGNLVTDAYRTLGAALQPDDPPVIAVDANGQIRADIKQGTSGNVWLADLFRVTPDGIGPDKKPGFPLVTFYLNAADIASGLELGLAPELASNDYFLQVSGLKVEHGKGNPLGRITRISLVTADGEQELDPTDTKTCYKIVTTNYVAGLLGVVEQFTGGLLSVTAKDSDCKTPVDPTTRFIDADPKTKGVQELKQWEALLGYVSALPDSDGDGIPNIPAAYGSPQGRYVEVK
jgi:5'-nucleotidase/UDP-sugar diphosphatase